MNKQQKDDLRIATDPLKCFQFEGLFPAEVKKAIDHSIGYLLTGSYFICDPRVENTDIDIMLLVTKFDLEKFVSDHLSGFKFQDSAENPEYEESGFISCRFFDGSKNFNILLTQNIQEFVIWDRCTRVARYLNLTNKMDRAALFSIMTGEVL